MKAFFEAIQTLFVDLLLLPYDFFRNLELSSWWGANIFNFVFMLICFSALVYWVLQLRTHQKNNEEKQDTTAHSFLK
ncbi:uracil phosphoribosyltransferase [Flavobacterium sp.]|uniref:DUF6341 family protein n=1 Tax=Flavobacterium sp. TaxID=239 RepID=UPI00260C5CAF|nr:uracil phosphoribosyltransferase [Flavobacterium sp.]MDD2984937.1 uracil phosphoribosyltransferase [Flavobacterium sp.]